MEPADAPAERTALGEKMLSAISAGAELQIRGPGPVPVSLRINGQVHPLQIEPRITLLDALRDRLGLTGTKKACDVGECGACTVLLAGQPAYACLLLAVECEGHEITTIEGLTSVGLLDPVQAAFVAADAVQCGFCTPGQIISVAALLRSNSSPTDDDVRHAIVGNLCRCGTYPKIVQAARLAADLIRAAHPGQQPAMLPVPEPGSVQGRR